MNTDSDMKPSALGSRVSGLAVAVVLAAPCFLWPICTEVQAAAEVTVNVNAMHSVGGISTFDRSKFITIHSGIDDREWTETFRGEDNFTNDLLAAFFEGHDAYFGRDTGYVSWHLRYNIDEDSSRSGWASITNNTDYSMDFEGAQSRNEYHAKTWLRPYEWRAQTDILCAQFHPFWPDGTTTSRGWALSQADTASEPFGSATGHYMGHFLNEFFGHERQVGKPLPRYVEVINEPDWELWGLNPPASSTLPDQLWKFHNSVADQLHNINPRVEVGGFCNAFPDHEYSNFQEWVMEWQAFIDHCGSNMDFYTTHLYDIDDQYAWRERKGSNLEATLDMIEHYSELTVGQPLPFVISEFGGRDRGLENGPWSSYRDWKTLKSFSSMLMSFADRPHLIHKIIPFIICKAEWGRGTYPYPWRLMRQAGEPSSYTGEWVYTDMVRFYQLWSDVRGTRVDIVSSNPDIQVDAYVNGDKVYVILNNLEKTTQTVDLALSELHGNAVQSVREKNLYLNGSVVALDEHTHPGTLAQVQLGAEGTAILEYAFAGPVNVDHTADETKHYADACFQPIVERDEIVFSIDGVPTGPYGDAVLRLGMGRDDARSRRPVVFFNDTEIEVPTNFMGHEGDDRDEFFGVLDIPVPYALVQASNTVTVSFGDSGGYVSSVALRAYAFSTDLRGTGGPTGSVFAASEMAGDDLVLSISNGYPSGYFNLMWSDDLAAPASNWMPRQTGLRFDHTGMAVVAEPMTEDDAFFQVRETGPPTIPIDSVSVFPESSELDIGQTVQLMASVSPTNATNPSVTWSSDTPAVAGVDAHGLVTALQGGTAIITAATTDSGFTDSSTVTVSTATQALFDWEEFAGVWWSDGYGYMETDNGITMVAGGRAAAHDGGDGAGGENGNGFKASYWQDQTDGTYVMRVGGVDQPFTVTSIDIMGDSGNGNVPAGDLLLRGMLGGVEQWAIDPTEDNTWHTYTSATTGSLSLQIDQLVWKAPYDPANPSTHLVWGNKIDNLVVEVTAP